MSEPNEIQPGETEVGMRMRLTRFLMEQTGCGPGAAAREAWVVAKRAFTVRAIENAQTVDDLKAVLMRIV